MPQPLVLVPTELERGYVAPVLAAACGAAFRVELCGFGPVVAAARAAQLLAAHRPPRVLLVGIAGRYSDRLSIGQAYAFERVACHGVGAGSGADFIPAAALGFRQWPGDATQFIEDAIDCDRVAIPAGHGASLLLSACAAAAGGDDVRSRLGLHPRAEAEDMEGFAVAAACRLAGAPVTLVRGISNTAGDREASGWRIEAACRAAGELAATLLGGRS